MAEEISGNPRVEEEELAGAGARIFREVVRTPVFMEIIKTNMPDYDPESARQMVRTLLWQDVDLSLGLLVQAPSMVNYMVEGILELGRQMNKFPEGMLAEFVTQMLEDTETGLLTEIPAVYGPLVQKLMANPEMRQKLIGGFYGSLNAAMRAAVRMLEALDQADSQATPDRLPPLDAAALGEAVTISARLVNRSVARNPYFLREVAENIDYAEVARAAYGVGRAAMLSAVSIAGRLARIVVDYLVRVAAS